MKEIRKELEALCEGAVFTAPHPDEACVAVRREDFGAACHLLHRRLSSPVMSLFAVDESKRRGGYSLYCVFEAAEKQQWVFVKTTLPQGCLEYPTLSKDIYSAHLFERAMYEMFGIRAAGSPDMRRLHLHDEVWPDGYYPLRKDFTPPIAGTAAAGEYAFKKIEGEGVFEVPVGPVHAGIIGPGHFRFSVAGEPVINLELRLGFTHRGVEKLFEGQAAPDAVALAERVSGDASFAHGLAFCMAMEKIEKIAVPRDAQLLRALFLELERLYNHASDIGGIALDVGFSYPHACACLIKETLLALNGRLCGSRYLKGINAVGGVTVGMTVERHGDISQVMDTVSADLQELKAILYGSVSFMDRVDTTGTLSRKVAEDLGVTGLAARASGIQRDLRKDFPGVYRDVAFTAAHATAGDVLARLAVRIDEFTESVRLVRELAAQVGTGEICAVGRPAAGCALGYAEGWRGPVLYWIQAGDDGRIDRCKVTDASFRNWLGLAHAVPGNIIPDFPLCNKSFDLSYSGNDL